MLETVKMLDAYTRWADAKMLEALESLPAGAWLREMGGSFGSLRNTATHAVSAQAVWLGRWTGRPLPAMWAPEEVPTPDVLRSRWKDTTGERAGFLEKQTDATLAAPLAYTTFDGKSHATPLGELWLHMTNHSTYHRGQVTTLLRMAGVKPQPTDFIVWVRAGKP